MSKGASIFSVSHREAASEGDPISSRIYYVDSSDPRGELVDRAQISDADMQQIGRLMTALGRLRDAERTLLEASQAYMKLSEQDMRALHYLIVAQNEDTIATPGAIAQHLGISAASTTKLLNRLEAGGHIVREVHPADRRAFAIRVTPGTRDAAMSTMGRQQAKRIHSAARLTADEREMVTRFLDDMAREISVSAEDWAQQAQ